MAGGVERTIDPAAAGDQATCRPDVLLDIAATMSGDLLSRLDAARLAVPDLPVPAAGGWDVARGYAETVRRARTATEDTMRFVADQVRRVVDDLVATANTVRDGDERAGDTARRTRASG
jgi:hypothetical protein